MNESQNNFCIDTGTLLSLHDGELTADETQHVLSHLATCVECAASDRVLQQGSHEARELLATLEPARRDVPDLAQAFAAMRMRLDQEGLRDESPKILSLRSVGTPHLLKVNQKRRYGWIASAVAAALIALLILPNAGVLANQFLSMFQVKQFRPVSVNPQNLNESFLSDLQHFGRVDYQSMSSRTTPVQSAAELQSVLHFPLLLPTSLPGGVNSTPHLSLFTGGSATFTFDANEARSYLAQKGYKDVSIPADLDGSNYTITMSAGAVITYQPTSCQGQANSAKAGSGQCMFSLLVVEIPSPVIQAADKSASLSELRDFFMALPDHSSEVRTLLQNVDLSNGVVPLPIPPQIHAQQVTTRGTSALLLNEQSLKVGAILWQSQGIIYLIAAQTGDSTDLLNTANSLKS